MSGDFWLARTPQELKRVLGMFETFCEEAEYPIAWKLEQPSGRRSLSQNALFAIWARTYCSHLLRLEKPSEAQEEAMRITLKRAAYTEHGWKWLLQDVEDLFTGQKSKKLRSSKDYDKGEMHMFLDFVQRRAAEDGLILEAMGEYLELQKAQVA
jgi:hypothetical protein